MKCRGCTPGISASMAVTSPLLARHCRHRRRSAALEVVHAWPPTARKTHLDHSPLNILPCTPQHSCCQERCEVTGGRDVGRDWPRCAPIGLSYPWIVIAAARSDTHEVRAQRMSVPLESACGKVAPKRPVVQAERDKLELLYLAYGHTRLLVYRLTPSVP